MKLRAQFFLWITALLTVMAALVGGVMIVSERQALKDEMKRRHHQLTESLRQVCEESLYKNDHLAFYNFAQALKQDPVFHESYFLDSKARYRFHSNPLLNGRLRDVSTGSDPRLTEFALPVRFADEPVGSAHLVLSQERIAAQLNQSTRASVLRILSVVALAWGVGFWLAFWLSRRLVRPIQDIVHAMENVANGILAPVSFPQRRDELGWMSRQLNAMISKLREVDEMKRDFVAAATHELRSPLAAINALLRDTIEDGKTLSEDERREFLLTAQNNTRRLERLVDDLLATAKIDAHKTDVNLERFEIRKVVDEVCALYESLSRHKQIHLSIEHPEQPVYVMADVEKVTQILHNLLSNAFKYTERGRVTVKISLNGKECWLSVSDTGLGIPKEDRERLFERFFRSQASAAKSKGTGLGLFIVKSLAELQGGRVWFAEKEGPGSMFIAALPLYTPA